MSETGWKMACDRTLFESCVIMTHLHSAALSEQKVYYDVLRVSRSEALSFTDRALRLSII